MLVADLIAPALAHIINLSMKTGIYPKSWKWAKVVPLLKSSSSDATMPKSYRPVALLPVLSKVMEKVVFSQLVKYLEENDLIHPNLHGSRKGHDTSTALLQLYDRWIEELEAGNMAGVLICDQSAAFDLCDHNILLNKLGLMGVDEDSLNWVKSYLHGRSQSCFIDGELSSRMSLPDCGVPQGSIGGPLLWLVFTCDQPDVIHSHEIDGQSVSRGCPSKFDKEAVCGELVGYVDDGAYTYEHKDPTVLSRVLSDKFKCLEEWMINNRLVLNPDKTSLIVLATKKTAKLRQEVNITAGIHCIRPSETAKHLGGYVHQSLKWNEHIAEGKASLIHQLVSRNNALKRICACAPFKTRLMLANGAFHSKLVYLITLWGGAQGYLINALQIQQLRAARTVCGIQSFRWSRRRLLKEVGWLSVRQLIVYHTIIQAHKTLISGKPAFLFNALTSEHFYETRSVAQGHIRLRNTRPSSKSFQFRAMITIGYQVKPKLDRFQQ